MKIDGFKCHPYIVLLISQATADILIVLETSKNQLKVRINSDQVVEAPAETNEGDFVEYYVGGAPSDVRERYEALIQRAVLPTPPLTCLFDPIK